MRRLSLAVAAVAVGSAAVLASTFPVPAEAATVRTLKFELRDSGGRFMANSFKGFGTQMTLEKPGKEPFGVGYRWRLGSTATFPLLENFDVPGCLDVGDGQGRTADFTPITVQQCDGSSSQRWFIGTQPGTGNRVVLRNEFSGKVVTHIGANVDGSKFVQRSYTGAAGNFAQLFDLHDSEG